MSGFEFENVWEASELINTIADGAVGVCLPVGDVRNTDRAVKTIALACFLAEVEPRRDTDGRPVAMIGHGETCGCLREHDEAACDCGSVTVSIAVETEEDAEKIRDVMPSAIALAVTLELDERREQARRQARLN